MSLRHYAVAAAALLVASSLWAAPDLIIPAAASADGPNGSRWQSEITLHNSGAQDFTVALSYYGEAGLASGPIAVAVPAHSTVVLADVVRTRFNSAAPSGAITIDADDLAIRKLGVTSRTFNVSPSGEFGQDIPAVALTSAMNLGDTAVLAGPSNAATTRFNFGIFALDETTVEWKAIRKDGTVAATVKRTYGAGRHTQHGNGITTLLGVAPQDADVVYARIEKGRAIFYGSAVNNQTGDPTFVPASRTRENLTVEVLGIDLDENGTVDIFDANGDGVLDAPITMYTATWPMFFRVIALDPEGQILTYSFVNAPQDVRFIDNEGTVQWFPSSSLKGTAGSLTVRVSDGVDSTDLLIPVLFR